MSAASRAAWASMLRSTPGREGARARARARRRRIEEIHAMLQKLTARDARAATAAPPLLSIREAAKALRLSRGRTLPTLLRSGAIRTVKVKGRTKIPASEIRRIEAEGLGAQAPTNAKRPAPARNRAPLARDLV